MYLENMTFIFSRRKIPLSVDAFLANRGVGQRELLHSHTCPLDTCIQVVLEWTEACQLLLPPSLKICTQPDNCSGSFLGKHQNDKDYLHVHTIINLTWYPCVYHIALRYSSLSQSGDDVNVRAIFINPGTNL